MKDRLIAALGFDAELRREMLCVIDRLTKEISGRFQQVHDLANKYAFLTPSYLLDDNYDCQLGEVDEDIEKEEFFAKRSRLKYFVEASGNDKIDGPFEQRYHLGDSAPNIVILLCIFLTRTFSVASCERFFSKLKLIKNYLRSAMSQTRLTDLAVPSCRWTEFWYCYKKLCRKKIVFFFFLSWCVILLVNTSRARDSFDWNDFILSRVMFILAGYRGGSRTLWRGGAHTWT